MSPFSTSICYASLHPPLNSWSRNWNDKGKGCNKRRLRSRSIQGGWVSNLICVVFQCRFSMDLCRSSAKRLFAKPGRSQRRDFIARPGVPGLLSIWPELMLFFIPFLQFALRSTCIQFPIFPQDLRAKRDDADRQLSRAGATQTAPNMRHPGPLHMSM